MDNERRLEDAKLVLFTLNGIWQARISIGQRRYLWKSLSTSNAANAERAARKLFYQPEQKLEQGLPVQSRSLDDVIDEYVAFRQRDHDLGAAAKRVRRQAYERRHAASDQADGTVLARVRRHSVSRVDR